MFAGRELTDEAEQTYFFCISAPQHLIVPFPPLVTIICEPHELQIYIFPSWLAMLISLLLEYLFSTKFWRSFFQKRPYAFRSILRRLEKHIEIFFQSHALVKRQIQRLMDRLFAKT